VENNSTSQLLIHLIAENKKRDLLNLSRHNFLAATDRTLSIMVSAKDLLHNIGIKETKCMGCAIRLIHHLQALALLRYHLFPRMTRFLKRQLSRGPINHLFFDPGQRVAKDIHTIDRSGHFPIQISSLHFNHTRTQTLQHERWPTGSRQKV